MDQGQRQTEALVKKLEKQLNKEYLQAIDEMEEELLNYFQRFEKKDSTWRRWVDNGLKTTKEYQEWRFGQMAVGKRWMEQMNSIAKEMNKVNETAKSLIRKYTPEMYANNYNYATYQVEKDARIDTSFNLVNKEAIEHIVREDPDVLPAPGKQVRKAIAEGKAERWNKKTLQSVMTQGILQGDSISKLATRLATAVGDKNRKAAIRNARTMATGAMNAGREDAFKRAQRKGVDLEQMWLATMDNRTRHTHRWIDREVRPVGEAFSNGCEYPGDPKGDPAEIYNCRCSLRGVVKGLERRSGKFRDDSAIKGMSYDEWKRARSKSNPIDLSEQKARNIKNKFISEYGNGPQNNGIIESKEDRFMTNREMANSLRTSPQHILTTEEIASLKSDARTIGIPEDVLIFNQGRQTGFRDRDRMICVRGDVLPDNNGTTARDRMSQRAVLAHEYYGHYKAYPSQYKPGDWRDEYNASRNAAINTPNLTDEERRDLMVDAFDRQKEAGAFKGYDKEARRLIYGY